MAVAAVARRGVEIAGKTRIRTRIAHVGSEYRRVLTLDACELCIADWAVGAIGIPFEFADLDTGATWEIVTPTLHVGPWIDIWEVRVNPFALSTALRHVTLTVDARRHADTHDEAPTSCGRGRGSVTRTGRRRGGSTARGRYSQATPSLSRSRRGL